MSSKHLKRLDLRPKILETFEKHDIYTCKDVLQLSRLELLNLLGVSDKKREEVVKVVSRACCPNASTAYNLYEQSQKSPTKGFLSTSLAALDDSLRGGIPFGSITELAGPASAGKTQFCLQLCILATLPTGVGGLEGAVAYIDTESTFCASRLKEIAVCRFPEIYHSEIEVIRLMQSVFIYHVLTTKGLQNLMQKLEIEVVRKHIKLIVVDSVAGVLRKEFSSTTLRSLVQRNKLLMELAALLKNLAETFGIVVFVTNHITTETVLESDMICADFEEDEDGTTGVLSSSAPAVRSASLAASSLFCSSGNNGFAKSPGESVARSRGSRTRPGVVPLRHDEARHAVRRQRQKAGGDSEIPCGR